MQTTFFKPSDTVPQWYLIDAKDVVPGRLAAYVARLIQGKHKPTYTPHADGGDYVVVVNAAHVHLTGRKRANEKKYWHTGYPGGIKEKTFQQILEGKSPEDFLKGVTWGMIRRKRVLRREQFAKLLKIYPGAEHPHAAQKPIALDFASFNEKNKKR